MRFIIRSLNAGVLAAVVACTGCQGLPWVKKENNQQNQPLSIMNQGGLLIGPDANGESKSPQELDPKRASQACLAVAGEMEKAGQTEEAINLYEKCRNDYPTLAAAISRRLGILYDKIGEFTKATTEYEIALKATPNDADLLCDVGYSYYSRNDWVTAEKHLRQAVKIQSTNKRAWLNLGLTLAAQRRWQESYDAFSMGVVSPAEANCNVAFCMASQGLIEDAKGQYRKALDVDPSMQMARVALTKLENMPPPGTVQQAAAKTPGDPSKIRHISEIMEQQRATEGAAKLRSKTGMDAPITVEFPR